MRHLKYKTQNSFDGILSFHFYVLEYQQELQRRGESYFFLFFFLTFADQTVGMAKLLFKIMNEAKQHILKTSLFLFLQKSYKDVTMSDIVKNTGLSKGAFYHYFTSKEELFREIVGMFFTMGKVNYEDLSAQTLKEFYGKYIDFLNNSLVEMSAMSVAANISSESKRISMNFFLIMFEAVNRFPEFLEMELQMHKADVAAWVEIIESARKSGEIKSDSSDSEIAELFLYCTDGVFIRFVNNDNPKAYKEFLTNTYDTIYNNIKWKR